MWTHRPSRSWTNQTPLSASFLSFLMLLGGCKSGIRFESVLAQNYWIGSLCDVVERRLIRTRTPFVRTQRSAQIRSALSDSGHISFGFAYLANMIYGIAILCARSGRHYFSREHVVGFGIPGESGLADAINFAGMIFALDCNCRDLQFSERHQEPVFKTVQTAERTLLVRHHFSFPVMAAVVAPPSTPLQLLGEFASEMLQAWVVSHAPSDPGGVPKRGFKTTYTTVLRSLVSRHVDAAFQAFGPSASWMMVARSNGVAGLCDAASAGIDSTANSTKSKAAQPVRVKRSNSLSSSSSALSVVPKASGFFSRLKSGQDPLLKQINGPAFGRSCCVRTSSSAAPPSADTQQYFTCCAVRASAALGVCIDDSSFMIRGDTLSSVMFTLHASNGSPAACVRAWRWGPLFLCLCHPLVEGACVMLPPGELSRRLLDLDSLLCLAEQSGVDFKP